MRGTANSHARAASELRRRWCPARAGISIGAEV